MRSRTEAVRRGFTLIEGLVTLVLITIIIVGLLTLLDSSSRLAKQETQAADAQGGGRSAIYEVTRLIREARVGRISPLSAVMPFVNNANGTTHVVKEGSVDHVIRAGTDAIEVRGTLFGDLYRFDNKNPQDVQCAGGLLCGPSSTGRITIKQETLGEGLGGRYQNFPVGGRPELANRTRPFYFVVSSASVQAVTGTNASGSAAQEIPAYLVGRVDAGTSGWYTLTPASAGTPATFQFDVTFLDAGAQELNAANNAALELADPFAGGALDLLILFVDRGPQDPASQGGGYTHPFLAQAVGRPNGAAGTTVWEVQRLVDDVEDLQLAYGIDGIGSTPDRGVDPAVISTTTKDGDEWVYSAAEEGVTFQAAPRRVEQFLVGPNGLGPAETGRLPLATEALRAVYVAIVTKSLDPDFKFDGPGARGVKMLDSTAAPVSATQPYRRRVQTMAVSLRNYI
mgnify:FL=1